VIGTEGAASEVGSRHAAHPHLTVCSRAGNVEVQASQLMTAGDSFAVRESQWRPTRQGGVV